MGTATRSPGDGAADTEQADRRTGEADRRTENRLTRVETLVDTHVAELERGRETREIVDKTVTQVDEIHVFMTRIATSLENLVEKVTPVLTERELVIRIFKWWGGVVVGAVVSILIAVIVSWLKTL